MSMILKTIIAAKVSNKGLEQASRVLEAHLFQYLEPEINKAMKRKTMREIAARAPP